MTTLASAFAGMLTDSITYQPVTSRNGDGEETLGAAVTYACRVQRTNKRIVSTEGQVVASDFQVFLITADALVATGWVTYGGEARRILKLEDYRDELTTPYKVIYA
jgi:hypothetical protein